MRPVCRDGSETRGFRVSPEVVGLEIGGEQTRILGGQLDPCAASATTPPEPPPWPTALRQRSPVRERTRGHPHPRRASRAPRSRRRYSPVVTDELRQRRACARTPACARSSFARRATTTFTRLGQQPGQVQPFPQTPSLVAGQARIGRGVEHGRHVVVHAAVLPLSSTTHPLDQIGWRPPRHLFHAYMLAGMHADRVRCADNGDLSGRRGAAVRRAWPSGHDGSSMSSAASRS